MYLAKKNKTIILLDLAFIDHPKVSGGKNRSLQIFELLQSIGFEFTSIDSFKPISKIKLLFWIFKYFLNFRFYRPIGYDSLREAGVKLYHFKTLFQKFPEITHVLQEGTGFGAIVSAPIVKKFKRKMVFVPANIEALAPYFNAWTHTIPLSKRLHEEFYYLNFADAVFCISVEETWLLKIAGINANFLPYFPPANELIKIQKRLELRKPDPEYGFLYYANFYNEPNFLGFKSFIGQLHENKLNIKINVAGIGSERIKDLASSIPSIKLLGELSEEDLEKNLCKCMGVILNHYPTSGMLTRVPEIILSDIPLIANMDALKAYCFINGTSVFPVFNQEDSLGRNQLIANYQKLKNVFINYFNC